MTIGVNYVQNSAQEYVIQEVKDDEIKVFPTSEAQDDTSDIGTDATVKTLDPLTVLSNKFGRIFTENNCKFDIKFICIIANCSRQELLNADEDTIKNIQEALKAAFAKIKYDPTTNNIKDIIDLAKNYNVALMTGWTIKEFDKKILNGESLSKKMVRFFDLPKDFDFKTASPETVKEYLSGYFITYFKELENEGYDKDTIVKLQLQDFGKMLINTPPEEKKLFKEAIKLLLAENKHQGIQAVFSSFANEKESCDFADSWGCSDIEALYNKDNCGTDAIDPMNSASLIMSEKSQEGMKELHNEMMEREKIYQEIKKKYEDGEELTKFEQYILDNHEVNTSMKSAELLALYLNENLEEDFRKTFAELVNKDYSQWEDYRDVLEGINDYITSHPNNAILNSEELKNFLDEITNGNYTIVMDDIKNGTNTTLNTPSETTGAVDRSYKPTLELTENNINSSNPGCPYGDYNNARNAILEHVDEVETMPNYMGHSPKYEEERVKNSIPQVLSSTSTTIQVAKEYFNSQVSFIRTILSEKYQTATKFVDYAYENLKDMSENGQSLIINLGIKDKYVKGLALDGALKSDDLGSYCYTTRKFVEDAQG